MMSLMTRVMLVLFGLLSCGQATSGQLQAQPFFGTATKGNLSVWRINKQSGAVSLCSYEGPDSKPSCYPWSKESARIRGSYDILAGDDLLSTWRIDTATGRVSMCEYADVAQAPVCTPWG